jgi:O-antigen ligase
VKFGGQRYLLGVWIAISVLTPAFAWLGARGFAPGVGLMGLLTLGYLRPKGKDLIGFGLLALAVAWAGVSAVWSAAPNLQAHGVKDVSRLTYLHLGYQLALAGAFVMSARALSAQTAQAALRWMAGGLVVMALILLVEGVSQAAVYQSVQGFITPKVRPDLAVRNVALGGYVLATLIWPVGAALARERRQWAYVAILLLAATVVFSTFALRGDSPTVACVFGVLAFGLVYRFGRPAVLALLGVTVVYWLLTPWIMLGLDDAGVLNRINGHLPASWDRRLEVWSFAIGRWGEDPFLGLGLDASRAYPGYIPLHPHDGAIQIWLELGVAGAVLAAAFWGLMFWRIAERSSERLFAATASATATVYLVIGAISFGLWQEWWICLGALALACCVALGRFSGQSEWDFGQAQAD